MKQNYYSRQTAKNNKTKKAKVKWLQILRAKNTKSIKFLTNFGVNVLNVFSKKEKKKTWHMNWGVKTHYFKNWNDVWRCDICKKKKKRWTLHNTI